MVHSHDEGSLEHATLPVSFLDKALFNGRNIAETIIGRIKEFSSVRCGQSLRRQRLHPRYRRDHRLPDRSLASATYPRHLAIANP